MIAIVLAPVVPGIVKSDGPEKLDFIPGIDAQLNLMPQAKRLAVVDMLVFDQAGKSDILAIYLTIIGRLAGLNLLGDVSVAR